MKKLLNVLYVITEKSYISKQGETICVHIGGKEKVRVPSHTIESIVCLDNTTVSTPLVAFCGKKGIGLSFFNKYGKFYGRLEGPVSGNVLLRREQYNVANSAERASKLVYWLVASKIANERNTLLRTARESDEEISKNQLSKGAEELARVAKSMTDGADIAVLRGLEGAAANAYFGVFDSMIRVNKEHFYFKKRSKRPPLDNVNAILSFLYTLLVNDTQSALEGIGLDPAVGFLHSLRPGRPSLALDLMEELRSSLCDRLALSLINRKQVQQRDFEHTPTGTFLNETGKKTVLVAWQKRKQDTIEHSYLKEKVLIGLIPHIQSQLLARYLRGDIKTYPPFYWK